MSPITTHVLDTTRGKPAVGVAIKLARRGVDGAYVDLGSGVTDADGRLRSLLAEGSLVAGVYRITFDTGAYFDALGTPAFYPEASVVFAVARVDEHYHVPLLLNAFGYSTYRGT
jgi:5-hydroxyisourate hydrolase